MRSRSQVSTTTAARGSRSRCLDMTAYSPVIHQRMPSSHRNQTGLTVGDPEALVVATRATRGWARDEGGPGIRDAIRAVIEGGPFDEQYGFMYGYAYKWICEFHGRFLDNSDFSPMRAGWLETVDEGLKALGVSAVSVTGLSYGGPPAPIPSSGMESGCGEWSFEECQKALEQWEAATDEAKSDLDPYVLEAAQSAMEWCRISATAGRGVAGFFS